MKTKDDVKMSRSPGVKELKSRAVRSCTRLQAPVAVGAAELAPRLLDSQLSTLNFLYDRSGNVIENKGSVR